MLKKDQHFVNVVCECPLIKERKLLMPSEDKPFNQSKSNVKTAFCHSNMQESVTNMFLIVLYFFSCACKVVISLNKRYLCDPPLCTLSVIIKNVYDNFAKSL